MFNYVVMWPSFGWQAGVPYGQRMSENPTSDSCRTHLLSFKKKKTSIISFLLPFIWFIISAFSSEPIVFVCSTLCAAVIILSAFNLLRLSSCSHLFESLRHVTWTNCLLLKAATQPRASILTRVLTSSLESLHALWITVLDIIGFSAMIS